MQPVIPREEVKFHPHSFGDPAGRLFRWHGELYRGVTADKAPFYSRLFNDGVMQGLIRRGLFVASEVTEFAADGYGMVIHHRTVRFPSYPNEWCAAMFKDATLAVLDLGLELARHDLALKDHHLWNLVFDGARPVYVDLTSIVPLNNGTRWPDFGKFCRYCLYPLLLMAAGHERIARYLLPDYEGVQRAEAEALTSDAPRSLRRLVRYRPRRMPSQAERLRELRDLIASIELPTPAADRERQPAVLGKLLGSMQPGSVLDIASPGATGARSAAEAGIPTVYFGSEAESVTSLYREARTRELPVVSLIMDFTKPTPSIGFDSHYSIAASERFQCEMVLAFDLVHRLVFERYLNFDQIAEGLAAFSKRWVIVEFTPRDSLTGLRAALGKRFRRVDPAGDAPVLVCEK
jgi:hypothetical protein